MFLDGPRNDTWEWDGYTWSLMAEGDSAPPGRSRHALVYDSLRERVLLYGGKFVDGTWDDTWSWDGSEWELLVEESAPSTQTGHAMAYDSARDRVVLVTSPGGEGESLATWEFDGTCWSDELSGADGPWGRWGFGLAYDEVRGKSVLYGGIGDGDTGLEDIWEWDGMNWREVPQVWATPPTHVVAYPAAYDPGEHRALVLGKFGQGQEFWQRATRPEARPAVLAMVDWASAGVGQIFASSVAVSAVAGGRGYLLDLDPADDGDLLGDVRDGWEIRGWDAWSGEWRTLVEAQDPPEEPAPSDFRTEDSWQAQRFFLTRDGRMHFMVRPSTGSGNGTAPGTIAVDYMEVAVDYHIGEHSP